MTQGERIKLVRKHLNLTLANFGSKIGLKANSLSQIETGINNLTESVAKSICREYNVNPHWLQTGEGDMFLDNDDDFLTKLDNILSNEDNKTFKPLLQAMLDLEPNELKVLNSLLDKLILQYQKNKEPNL